jgi:hypothetical protein
MHLVLQLDRAAHRINDAGEFGQEPVAGRLDNPATMLRDLEIAQLAPDRFERRERGLLVHAHEPRVPGDISRQYRRQPALDPLPPAVHGGDATAISSFTIALQRRAVPT